MKLDPSIFRLCDHLPNLGMQVVLDDGTQPQPVGYLKRIRPEEVRRSGKSFPMVTVGFGRFDFSVKVLSRSYRDLNTDQRPLVQILEEFARSNIPHYAEMIYEPNNHNTRFSWQVLAITPNAYEPLFDVDDFEPLGINGPDTASPIWGFHDKLNRVAT